MRKHRISIHWIESTKGIVRLQDFSLRASSAELVLRGSVDIGMFEYIRAHIYVCGTRRTRTCQGRPIGNTLTKVFECNMFIDSYHVSGRSVSPCLKLEDIDLTSEIKLTVIFSCLEKVVSLELCLPCIKPLILYSDYEWES